MNSSVHSRCGKWLYAPTSRSRTSVPRDESGSTPRPGGTRRVWPSACRICPLEDVSASPSPHGTPGAPPRHNKAASESASIKPDNAARGVKPFHPTKQRAGARFRLLNPPRRLQSAPRPIDGGVGSPVAQVHRVPLLSEGSVLPWSAVSNDTPFVSRESVNTVKPLFKRP